MGMAASQARLLSITSRMSDNELKSQLINNAKMRLTTDSSKASEKYLAALNATQLMFSNYTLEGESQYQQLTFNSLTAYSAYNNQYGLVNKGGELLVSELDSARFEEAFKVANADASIDPNDTEGKNAKALEEFLKSYGLVKDTTYFEKEALYKIDPKIKEMYEGDMVFEYNANGANGLPEAVRLSGIHYGYEDSKNSKDYGIYLNLLDDYTKADKIYDAAIKEDMHDYVSNLQNGAPKPYAPTYKDVIEWANGLEFNDDGTLKDPNSAITSAGDFQEYMRKFYNQLLADGYMKTEGVEDFKNTMEFYLNTIKLNSTWNEEPVQAYKYKDFNPALTAHYDANGQIDYYYYIIDESDQAKLEPLDPPEKFPDQDTGLLDAAGNPITAPVMEIITRHTSNEDFVQSIIDMYRFFQGEVLGTLNRDAFAAKSTNQKVVEARDNFNSAAKKLSQFIYGKDIGSGYYDKLDDMEWIIYGDYKDPNHPEEGRTNAPIAPTTALDTSEGGVIGWLETGVFPDGIAGSLDPNDMPYQANFQVVKDIYLCEKMMEEYGTPSYEWIDLNNRDENGEKKAEWYTNLFNRMLEGGYETLENGLATSAEWLQFALESGLISMEQVDVKKEWVSTMYSNCSNITESQIDVDITIAEAEYTKAMNDIEAKDKRYDIELKNIDTEHQSLQTEYDSIKSVIDKNVERNFKMFEA